LADEIQVKDLGLTVRHVDLRWEMVMLIASLGLAALAFLLLALYEKPLETGQAPSRIKSADSTKDPFHKLLPGDVIRVTEGSRNEEGETTREFELDLSAVSQLGQEYGVSGVLGWEVWQLESQIQNSLGL
jgi:hypothetical protein